MGRFRKVSEIKKDQAAGKPLSKTDMYQLQRSANKKPPSASKGVGRGRGAGSRKGQFKSKATLAKTGAYSPQTKAQIKRLGIKEADLPKVSDIIEEIKSVTGRDIKKSLLGMAEKLGATASDIRRINAASPEDLERVYKEKGLYFEVYWEYPITPGDDRSDTLHDIFDELNV